MSTLYHYTSLQGLIGMITGKSIWASHCEFLNDSSEFIHALSFAKSYSSHIYMEDDYLAGFGWVIRDSLENMIKHKVFVSSFSEKNDLLSQWRGYCPQGAGVSIGFDQKLLKKYCEENGFKLEQCIYNEEDQQKMILDATNECLNQFPKRSLMRSEYNELSSKEKVEFDFTQRKNILSGESKLRTEKALSNLCEKINDCAPLIKHSSFYEESEWRLVSRNPSRNIEYRVSKSHIVPFLVLPVIKEYPDIIKQICIGPNPNSHRCLKSIEQLLMNEGLEGVDISVSNIPFNSW